MLYCYQAAPRAAESDETGGVRAGERQCSVSHKTAGAAVPGPVQGVTIGPPRRIPVQVWLGCDLKAAEAEEGVGGSDFLFCMRCDAKSCDKHCVFKIHITGLGETLWSIAEDNDCYVKDLLFLNSQVGAREKGLQVLSALDSQGLPNAIPGTDAGYTTLAM